MSFRNFMEREKATFDVLLIIALAFSGFQGIIVVIVIGNELWSLLINPIFIVVECVWVVMMALMLKSLYLKWKQITKEKKLDDNLKAWMSYKCPHCDRDLEVKDFNTENGVWKFKYCPRCKKTYGKTIEDVDALKDVFELTDIPERMKKN